MSEAINRALAEALEREPEMMILGQDVGAHGGVFGVTRGLQARFGADAVRDAPLAESSTVGFAIGLAVRGVRAVVELEFFDFVGVAMDQVFNQAAKLHYFTGGRLEVPLVIRVPIVARMGMGPQHSQSLESWFMHVPGLRIAVPSDAADAYGLLQTALTEPNPVLFVECVRLYGRRGTVDLDAPAIPFGQARIVRPGRDATIVAISGTVVEALAAADELATRGIECEVIDPRTLAPFDLDTIVRSVQRTQRAIVTHDAHRTCGVGAEIAARIAEHAFDYLDAPVERICGLDVPVPPGPLLESVYPTPADLVAAVERTLERSA
jgi:pyruvate dehydrogenase E1 component beta subunit